MNALNRIQHDALHRIQWCRNDSNGKGPYCPSCRKFEHEGHTAQCVIGRALTLFEGAESSLSLLTPEVPRG